MKIKALLFAIISSLPYMVKADSVHVGVKFSFQTAMSTVGLKDYPKIKELIKVKSDFPNASILISGHTDWIANDEINQVLSEGRAEQIRDMILKYDKNSAFDKIDVKGFGRKAPIADNSTDEGRQKNRRFTVSFFNLSGEESRKLIEQVENSKYLYIISYESKLTENHIAEISTKNDSSVAISKENESVAPQNLAEEDQNESMSDKEVLHEDQPKTDSEVQYVEASSENHRPNSFINYWNGCYVGVNGGLITGPISVSNTSQISLGSGTDVFNQKFNISGFLLGLNTGCNFKVKERLYGGIELDYFKTNAEGDYYPVNSDITVEAKYLVTLRAKFGKTWERTFLYSTLGVSLADIEIFANQNSYNFRGYEKKVHLGIVLGVGLEYALTKRLFFQTIAAYNHYFDNEYVIVDRGPNSEENAYADGRARVLVAKIGINYKF